MRTSPPGGDRRPSTPTGRASRSRVLAAAVLAAVVAVSGGIAAAVVVGDGGAGGDNGDDPTPEPTVGTSFVAQSPEDILLASEKEMAVLDSVRVRGQFPDGDDHIAVDMAITADGDCRGTMSFLGSGTAQVLRTEGRTMIKPDARILGDFGIDDAQQFLEFLDGRWLEFTDADQFESVCDLDDFLERDGRGGATATNGGVVSLRGEDAVKVHLQEGSNRETYFVMVADPHYLLRIDETRRAWFEYSEFDADVTVDLPPERRIVKQPE